ncbi:hypothetical protein [Methylopila sp. M107]|uniref:hypothetical protein n=1 Tax=Methylopila sp. M107 TaxID=1101190 RepID=UPI000363DCED|nr:hypothetical protein [Methylopila sp. M107]
MNAALDYDTLEILGSAMRDETAGNVAEPLPEGLLDLYRRLEAQGRDDASKRRVVAQD